MASQDWLNKDFYALLGVAKDASDSEIKKAYRKLAKSLHPDRHAGDAAKELKFKEVGEAYSVLSDPEQRKQYDAIRSMTSGGARFTSGGRGGGNGGFEDVFSTMFGGGAAVAGLAPTCGSAPAAPVRPGVPRSRTCWAACSAEPVVAAASARLGGRAAAPTSMRRPGSASARPSTARPCSCARPTATSSPCGSRPASRTGSGSGWPARADRVTRARQPATWS